MYYEQFKRDMKAFVPKISLSSEDIKARKDLIAFVRNKLKNRNYTQRMHEAQYGKVGVLTDKDDGGQRPDHDPGTHASFNNPY